MANRLRYLESLRDTTYDFWTDQYGNWERIWDRVQTDQYTYGNWVRDAFQTWDGLMYGALRFASLPNRQFQGVVPTIVLVSDGQGDPGPKGEVSAPDGLKYGNAQAVMATPFTVQSFNAFEVRPRADRDSKTVVIEIVAAANPAQQANTFQQTYNANVGNFRGQSASALVYQGNTPIAQVVLSFK